MTKYILHGGASAPQSEDNRLFYQEMVKDLTNPKVLLVYFAREFDEYDYLKNRDINNFRWANPEVQFTFAFANEDDFIRQVQEADAVFFAGGTSYKLIAALREQDVNLKQLFEGKIISGSSAGANMMSEWFYGYGAKEVGEGLGVLPITVFVHYKADKDTKFWLSDESTAEIEKELIEKSGRSEIIRIPEQKFQIVEI